MAGEDVDFAYMGQGGRRRRTGARPTGCAQGGIPLTVPSTAINQRPSGLNAIALSHRQIAVGEAELAGRRMESMTQAPYILQQGRAATAGDATMHDSLTARRPLLLDEHELMGAGTERCRCRWHGPRADGRILSDVARAPRRRRMACWPKRSSVAIKQRKGDDLIVADDEGIRVGTTAESLGSLRGAFGGAGMSPPQRSQISDGGAATVVTTKAKAEALGVEPLAEIISYGEVAGLDTSLLTQPSRATMVALSGPDSAVRCRPLRVQRGVCRGRRCVDGRPRRPRRHRQRQWRRHRARSPNRHVGRPHRYPSRLRTQAGGGGIGVAALCGGGGQGDALVIKVDGRS